MTKIFSVFNDFRAKHFHGFERSFGCFDKHRCGESVWNVVFTDNDLYIDTECVGWTQNLNNSSPRWPAWGGEAGDLHIHRYAF
jgi:hypothetical protein